MRALNGSFTMSRAKRSSTDETLFTKAAAKDTSGSPLAERMRPRTLEGYVGQANVAIGGSVELASLRGIWPRYTPNPAYAGKIATTHIPILLQQGGFDFITSAVYQPLVDGLSGPTQTFVLYPRDAGQTKLEPCPVNFCSSPLLRRC